jgi:hypothetical protein
MHTSATISRSTIFFLLLHGDLLDSFDVIDLITKSIDDLKILDDQDSVPSVTEMLHVVPETLIMLLLHGLQSFSGGRMLVCALQVADEHGT